ncbi:MAG: hypothetical protein HYU69_08620 [Bacteroidetes bacterium]|nr:hypothetical protein [Bacteroidota bacterium]
MKKLILLSLLIVGSYSGIYSQKPAIVTSDKSGWHKIGETTVNFKTETDEIAVMGADRFAFIKIKVNDASIHLTSFDIHFETGDKQSVIIGQEIKAPGETRVVQLTGGERSIKKVSFIYKTVANAKDKKARVELWGLKTNPDKKTSSAK